jgi:hypothetical protein
METNKEQREDLIARMREQRRLRKQARKRQREKELSKQRAIDEKQQAEAEAKAEAKRQEAKQRADDAHNRLEQNQKEREEKKAEYREIVKKFKANKTQHEKILEEYQTKNLIPAYETKQQILGKIREEHQPMDWKQIKSHEHAVR